MILLDSVTKKYPGDTEPALDSVSLHIEPTTNRKYADESMLKVLGISNKQNVSKNIDNVRNFILGFWDDEYGILRKGCNKSQKDDAYDYIVYKTLKIIRNYKKYRPIFTYLSKEFVDYKVLTKKMKSLAQDYSHITKKLFQTINYLITDMYASPDNNYNLNLLEEEMDEKGMVVKLNGRYVKIKQNLLPPPIFKTDLILTKDEEGNGTIPFSSISSGERQIAYTISNLMYHLVNVDSEWNDSYRKDKDHLEVIKYRYMNVIFDEVELYFHPEYQRTLIAYFLKQLERARFRHIMGIHLMFVTHSPFILSDVSNRNVLYLSKEDRQPERESFAANIYDLLDDHFFLDETIGDIALGRINELVDVYRQYVGDGRKVEHASQESRIYGIKELWIKILVG